MDGTGTVNDPYLITSFAELLMYSTQEVGTKYLKLMNDLDLSKESSGSVEWLIKNVDIDGNGKTISNWTKTTGYSVFIDYGTYSKVHDLNFNNINIPSTATAFMCGNDLEGFENCTFRGQINTYFAASTGKHTYGPIKYKSCSFKIKDLRTGSVQINGVDKGMYFDSCYFQYEGNIKSDPLWDYQAINGIIAVNSYFDIKLPNSEADSMSSYNNKFKNCALDITTPTNITVYGDPTAISIFNLTHGASMSGSNAVGITNDNWLNIQALEEAGFNVVP